MDPPGRGPPWGTHRPPRPPQAPGPVLGPPGLTWREKCRQATARSWPGDPWTGGFAKRSFRPGMERCFLEGRFSQLQHHPRPRPVRPRSRETFVSLEFVSVGFWSGRTLTPQEMKPNHAPLPGAKLTADEAGGRWWEAEEGEPGTLGSAGPPSSRCSPGDPPPAGLSGALGTQVPANDSR